MMAMSERRQGAPEELLMPSLRRTREPLADGQAVEDLHARASGVPPERHRPQGAATVLDDDGIAVRRDGLARSGDHAPRLAPQPHGDAAPREERPAGTRDLEDHLARPTRRVDEGSGVDDPRGVVESGPRDDGGGLADAKLTGAGFGHADARE